LMRLATLLQQCGNRRSWRES